MNAQIYVAPSKLVLGQRQRNGYCAINGSKRSSLEIIAGILLFCHKGKAKTRIMFANNLNHPQIQNYLNLLTSRGLLALENGKYVTTEKGLSFTELFTGIHEILKTGK